MINQEHTLILIKGEDKTSSIASWRYNKYKPLVHVIYKKGKEYSYNIRDFQIFTNPQVVPLNDCIALKDGTPASGAVSLQLYGDYCRIIYKSGYQETVWRHRIKVVASVLQSPKSNNCFEYLKQLAIQVGLVMDGHNILAAHYDKMDFVREDSALAAFLSGKLSHEPTAKNRSAVYPFGFNLSQKQAVDNALCNQISIIEGPPGTGKTQTILNIIANAVMRGESVAIVSSNNSATDNVLEKLKKYGVDFIAAPLGNASNKEAFLTFQSPAVPNMSQWHSPAEDLSTMRHEELELDKMLALRNELSALCAEQDALRKEHLHFQDYYQTLSLNGRLPRFGKRVSATKILNFTSEYELLSEDVASINWLKKIRLLLTYGLKDLHFFDRPPEEITPHCQNLYYHRRLAEIALRITTLQSQLESFDFDSKMKRYSNLSMVAFKATLARKYATTPIRRLYTAEDLWKQSEKFIQDYPVVLSTTYSLRSSLSSHFVYDYVIVDEASQVDLVTAALALSCGKKVVIVGDLKQLPNVVDAAQKKATDAIFQQFGLSEAYRYSEHSLLSAAVALFPNAPHVLLREHYRCHPDIIGFCNQRFYNNELIVLTESHSTRQPLVVYRTAPGNHARDHMNQRQVDVITQEVFPQQNLNSADDTVGIVTPYRNQANLLQSAFAGTTVKADTADKFQGQERSVMIFSTVDNEIGDFASNPNRLNVAVSRAIDQFIVVTDGNDNDSSSPIHDLIGYIQYHNHEVVDSEIHSVFDYLYKGNALAREAILRKYGRVSDVDSENLIYRIIRDVLCRNEFQKYDVVMHVPLRMILSDLTKLDSRELSFSTNHLTHVDFLIYSRLTHRPVLVVEVDGFRYHRNPKQQERDGVKNRVLSKYGIPILRFNTVGSGEESKLIAMLTQLNET